MPPTRALLACDVFLDEIAALRDRAGPALGPVAWLEMGLHDQPTRLRENITHTIAALESDPAIAVVLLAYGRCGNGLVGVRAGRVPLVLPRAHDCISILLGGPAAHETVLREQPGAYFYSPGWIRGRRVPGPDRETWLRELYAPRHPDDPEIIDDLIETDREAFAHQDCAAYVDITRNCAAESACRDCARHLGWTFRRLPGDPTLLSDLLTGPWDDTRFLVVPPGRVIRAAADGRLHAS